MDYSVQYYQFLGKKIWYLGLKINCQRLCTLRYYFKQNINGIYHQCLKSRPSNYCIFHVPIKKLSLRQPHCSDFLLSSRQKEKSHFGNSNPLQLFHASEIGLIKSLHSLTDVSHALQKAARMGSKGKNRREKYSIPAPLFYPPSHTREAVFPQLLFIFYPFQIKRKGDTTSFLHPLLNSFQLILGKVFGVGPLAYYQAIWRN